MSGGRIGRRADEPVELTALRGWMRNAKGRRTFDSIVRRAEEAGMPVSDKTLRRALTLDSGLPRRSTVLAFARGAAADMAKAGLMWEAAVGAVRPRPVMVAGDRYVPGRFTTQAGMTRAMLRMCAAAGDPPQGATVAAGGGRFSRRDLDNALSGRRLASEQLVIDFAAAIGASEKATRALLDGRARILAGPPGPLSSYSCAMYEWLEERHQGNEAAPFTTLRPAAGAAESRIWWVLGAVSEARPSRSARARISARRCAPVIPPPGGR
ncbi:hypothetical protein OG894_41675 [Streptomyces sp. NBC_01724]|uniref:hypothetical protein n=1 Tax=unclassified Streptomyces TaxID=2593676 RepID=UPI002E365462|nr:hypothetical protein [Streptomyces sp. NBC_01724]WTE49259.1 hypothetical protein OG987_00115 [Streptomyces sp. NBC_01620]